MGYILPGFPYIPGISNSFLMIIGEPENRFNLCYQIITDVHCIRRINQLILAVRVIFLYKINKLL